MKPSRKNKWQRFNQLLFNTRTASLLLSPAMLSILFTEVRKNAWYHYYTKHNSLQATCYPLCRKNIERSKTLLFVWIHSMSILSAQAEDLSWIIQDQTCWGCWKFNTSALQETPATTCKHIKQDTDRKIWNKIHKFKLLQNSLCP